MRSAWSAPVKVTAAGLGLAVWVGWGCSDASERANDAENRDSPQLTDLRSTLMPGSSELLKLEPASSESREASGTAPRSDEDDPSCQDTCSSKHYECGRVCGQDCGKCRDGEECRNGKCECNSTCDGTRCSNACGQACECAAGTVCDVSGMCMPPDRACKGPDCLPTQPTPEEPGGPRTPISPQPPNPAPVDP